jgi:hypothetical protein
LHYHRGWLPHCSSRAARPPVLFFRNVAINLLSIHEITQSRLKEMGFPEFRKTGSGVGPEPVIEWITIKIFRRRFEAN